MTNSLGTFLDGEGSGGVLGKAESLKKRPLKFENCQNNNVLTYYTHETCDRTGIVIEHKNNCEMQQSVII